MEDTSRMESRAHRHLKRLALSFLREQGAPASALEVRCPISRFVLDVAGYRDKHGRSRCEPRTIIIECKQSREDFLRETQETETLLKRRKELAAMRASIEEHRIKVEEPELRIVGTSLFAELDEWNFSASRLPSYHKVLAEIERIEERLYGETKFHLIARYALADFLYLAAPMQMIRRHELPRGWGLLECPPQWLDEQSHRERLDSPPMLNVRVEAPERNAKAQHRLRLLRNIAVAASMRNDRRQGFRSPRSSAQASR